MARQNLPPRYVNIPAGPAYDEGLPDGVFRTYVQLRGLAWGKDRLDEITVKEIVEATGKSRSTIYGHLGILRDRGWLLFNAAHYSWLTVEFCGSGPDGEKDSKHAVDNLSRNLDCLNEEVKDLNILNQDFNLPPDYLVNPREKLVRKSGQAVQKSGQVSKNLDKNNGWHDVIDRPLEGKLERLGVFPQVYGQVAEAVRSGEWTLEKVKELADDILDLGDSAGPGVFVFRLKNRIRPETAAEKQEKTVEKYRKLYQNQSEEKNGA